MPCLGTSGVAVRKDPFGSAQPCGVVIGIKRGADQGQAQLLLVHLIATGLRDLGSRAGELTPKPGLVQRRGLQSMRQATEGAFTLSPAGPTI